MEPQLPLDITTNAGLQIGDNKKGVQLAQATPNGVSAPAGWQRQHLQLTQVLTQMEPRLLLEITTNVDPQPGDNKGVQSTQAPPDGALAPIRDDNTSQKLSDYYNL